jgi:hypothetical protein
MEERRAPKFTIEAVARTTLAAFLALLSAVGCGEPYRSKQLEAENFIVESIPIGTRRETVLRTLRVRQVAFALIQPADCDGFVYERRFACRGGSAMFVTNEINLWSWREPLSTPNLRTFLAFDPEEKLADYTIFLDGFD